MVPKRSSRDGLSAALRLAHVLNIYHALDAEITTEETALTWNKLGQWPVGNVVFIGPPSSTFAQEMLNPAAAKTGAHVVDSNLYFGKKKFAKAGQGTWLGSSASSSGLMEMVYYDRGTIFAPAFSGGRQRQTVVDDVHALHR